MNRLSTFTLTTMALVSLIVALPAGHTFAQQTAQKVSYKVTAENSKFTQQQFLDIGDVPGHQVRSFELHRTFPTNAPVINGVKVKEMWTRGISDYTNNTGANTNYSEYVLENGDKFYTRATTIAQGAGGGKLINSSAGTIIGGTGTLTGIRGIVKSSGSADPKAGFNETQAEIEYMIVK
jgi:hypothetical protein